MRNLKLYTKQTIVLKIMQAKLALNGAASEYITKKSEKNQ